MITDVQLVRELVRILSVAEADHGSRRVGCLGHGLLLLVLSLGDGGGIFGSVKEVKKLPKLLSVRMLTSLVLAYSRVRINLL